MVGSLDNQIWGVRTYPTQSPQRLIVQGGYPDLELSLLLNLLVDYSQDQQHDQFRHKGQY